MHWTLGLLLLGALYYFMPGLVGRDPWKQDETYTFSMILNLLQGRDWVVMHVAGEPFMEKPPLYYWSAALLAKLLSGVLPLHDAARLTSGAYMVAAFAVLGESMWRAWGRQGAVVCCLALAACPSLMLHGHCMITDTAQFFGTTLVLAGLLRAHEPGRVQGALLGLGLLVTLLTKGLLIPGVTVITGMGLAALSRQWRNKQYLRHWLMALAIAIPLGAIWPTLLYLRSPQLFYDWFWLNNIGRFLGFAVPILGAATEPAYFLRSVPSFAFPVLPLALWSLWVSRRQWNTPRILVPGLFASVIFFTLSMSASARALYALPLLAPLAMLAFPAVIDHGGRVDRIIRYLSLILFGALAIFVAVVWGYGLLVGHMPEWEWLVRMLPSSHQPPLQPLACVVALVAAALWVAAAVFTRGCFASGLMSWTAGLMLLWTLAMTLWLPWLDEAKSYRQVMVDIRTAMADNPGCVASLGLGESERSMLHYFGRTITKRVELQHDALGECRYLLIEDTYRDPIQTPDGSWLPIWSGTRIGDQNERFRLYTAG
ncbi:ArnT family glycosyltransferase [Andreprevotia lacus]|nr:hypothetical protein [Andreprevotia lacus]